MKYGAILSFGLLFFLVSSGFAQTEIPLSEISIDRDALAIEDIGDMCSLGCALDWHVKASSHLATQAGNEYDVEKLNDGLVRTAWVEGVDGQGVGEWILFSFPLELWNGGPPDRDANDMVTTFWGLRIINGYAKNASTWGKNSRVKKIRVDHNLKSQYTITLHDIMDMQEVTFPELEIRPGDQVTVTILDVYPGSKYSDTAISELTPLGAH